jgi:hypothetical protein
LTRQGSLPPVRVGACMIRLAVRLAKVRACTVHKPDP